ncbi:MAG: tRNA (guanosine(37)-N1)-methyltransferase TrmD [Myxococcota bacterium]|nr:tRNA (guanosine(37)-N1)-methyltransferase TrmD [Myxococcota bacterium]
MNRPLHIDILTLHADMFVGPLQSSILGRAQKANVLQVGVHNLRDEGIGRYKQVDDTPYGGGCGMVLRIDVIDAALQKVRTPDTHVVLMDPVGKRFHHSDAVRLSKHPHLVFLCGHYEGVDARVREHLVDESLSLGDYILTGGELAALVMIDAIARHRPGVLGNQESLKEESFSDGLLEAPAYTRPRTYNGWDVPEILLSGHHERIRKWREDRSLMLTKHLRPDLMQKWLDRERDTE